MSDHAARKGLSIAGSAARAEPLPEKELEPEGPQDAMDTEPAGAMDAEPAATMDTEPADAMDMAEPANSAARAERSVEGWVVVVTGVHEEAREEDLLDRFADYGPVRSLHMNLDRQTGFVKGYALLEFREFDHARAAVEQAAGSSLLGQRIAVDFAFVKSERPDDDDEVRGEDRHRRRRPRPDRYAPDRHTSDRHTSERYAPDRYASDRERSPDRGF
ncbi:proteasome regulatory particle subunit [Coemansia sp. Cherry 401B]|nr:proteasome regulatory particle subunit [Coemansia sp. Cherry 401B]